MESWLDQVEDLLIKELKPSKLIIEDVTHEHVKHANYNPAKRHLKVEIESSIFAKKNKVDQHKIVYSLLEPYLKNKIHSIILNTQESEF